MDTNNIKNMIRVGIVSSVDVANMTAKVMFTDKTDGNGAPLISANLSILSRGSRKHKEYWVPDIDEQVLCVFLPNVSGCGSSDGYIVGCIYSSVDEPIKTGEGIRRIDFGDGSYVEHNRNTGDMTIHATGTIRITGSKIYLNE